jgi:predicted nucleotidyltransferase
LIIAFQIKTFLNLLLFKGSKMSLPSKEEKVLEIFFNNPTKQWHFSELKKETKLADSKLAKWLTKFQKEKLILRNKPEKKMPHYISNRFDSHFQNKKKLFAMQKLYESGLLDHLASLEKPKLVILFGSIVSWNWQKESDIDLFIYGDDSELKTFEFEKKLGREIQVFSCPDEKKLKQFGSELVRNILRGIRIKGELPYEVLSYAGIKQT